MLPVEPCHALGSSLGCPSSGVKSSSVGQTPNSAVGPTNNLPFQQISNMVHEATLYFACRTLPRIGLHFGVPKQWNQVKWFGAGPHECYWDRKSGAPVREYSSTVQDMHVPYIVPGKHLQQLLQSLLPCTAVERLIANGLVKLVPFTGWIVAAAV